MHCGIERMRASARAPCRIRVVGSDRIISLPHISTTSNTGNLDVFRALPQLFLGLRTSSLASEERRWGFICMGKCMGSCPFDTTSNYPPPTVEGAAAPVLIYWFWFLDPTVRFRSD